MGKPTNYFCILDEFKPHLPGHMQVRTLEEWVAASKRGEFVPVFRFGGGVYFRKSAVLAWAERVIGHEYPELVVQMKDAGFKPAE